jgi:copper(I)-binding protein
MNIKQACLSTLVALALAAQAQDVPRVEGAWARPTVSGQSGGGGFLKITAGRAADRLIGVRAPVSKSTELHTMQLDGVVMRMRPIDAIVIPAGQTVELKPGGNHVMFMGLAQPLRPGARFPLTLRFETAGELTVEVQVANEAPQAVAPSQR